MPHARWHGHFSIGVLSLDRADVPDLQSNRRSTSPQSPLRKGLMSKPLSTTPPNLPTTKTASNELERLRLFGEWLQYGLHPEHSGFVVFEGSRGSYIQFSVGDGAARCEVGTMMWQEIFGGPLPISTAQHLQEKGFIPPGPGQGPNYWQDFEDIGHEPLAELTTWVFNSIFVEDSFFTAAVAGFEFN